jgi:hypothetical protein
MTDFAEALADVVADLVAAGLSASTDPADVNPPGVLVRPDDVTVNAGKLCGTETLRVSLLLIVPDTPTRTATADLARLAARVGPAARVAGLVLTTDPRTFERVALPDDSTALPCLRITALATYAPTTTTTTTTTTTERIEP